MNSGDFTRAFVVMPAKPPSARRETGFFAGILVPGVRCAVPAWLETVEFAGIVTAGECAQALLSLAGLTSPGQIPGSLIESYPGAFPAGNLPVFDGPLIGRSRELASLAEMLAPSPEGGVSTAVIEGAPGSGKTRLAVAYALSEPWRYRHVWCIDASSPEGIGSSMLLFAAAKGLCEPGRWEMDQGIRDGIREWLSRHTGWLFIADGALSPRSLDAFIPWDASGALLAACRRSSGGFGSVLVLEEMTDEECALVMAGVSAAGDPAFALKAAGTAGGLPALARNFALCMKEAGITCEEFLEVVATVGAGVFSGTGAGEFSWIAFWKEYVRRVQGRNFAAWQLLCVASWMGTGSISCGFFIRNRERLPEPLASCASDEQTFNGLLEAFAGDRAVRLGAGSFEFPPFLCLMTREYQTGQDAFVKAALKMACQFFDGVNGEQLSQEEFTAFSLHSSAVANHACAVLASDANAMIDAASLLNVSACARAYAKDTACAVRDLSLAFDLAEKRLPNNLAFRAAVCRNLAQIHRDAMDYSAALQWYERLASTVSGMDDPDAAADAREELARALRECGRKEDAAAEYSKSLTLRSRSENAKDEEILLTLLSLANTWHEAGDLIKATGAYEQVFEMASKDPVFSDFLSFACQALCELLRKQGENKRALEYGKARLKAAVRNSTGEAPDCYGDLALTHNAMGQADEALGCWLKAVEAARVSPVDPEKLLAALSGAAAQYSEMSMFPDAFYAYEETLRTAEEIFGDGSVQAASAGVRFAIACRDVGDPIRGLEAAYQALKVFEEREGEESLPAGDLYFLIASCFEDAGDYETSFMWHKKAFSLRQSVAGELDRRTAASCFAVARQLELMGEIREAMIWYVSAVDVYRSIEECSSFVSSAQEHLTRLGQTIEERKGRLDVNNKF